MPMLAAGQRGTGFFGDLWSGIKNVASKVKPSTVLSLVPDPRAQSAARVAGAVGLGRKKKRSGKKKTGGARKGVRKPMSGAGKMILM